jgi:cation:H+ antiporter
MSFASLAPWLLLGGGILLLGQGASWLVDGASRLALRLGISPMVVGFTVVGFGTSMPEFSVSVLAAMRGSTDLSLGNAVGSNIMNLLLVLGAAAVLVPIQVVGSRRLLTRDLIFGLVPAAVLLVCAGSGMITRPSALVLLVIFAAFMVITIVQERGSDAEPTVIAGSPIRYLLFTAVGIAVLVAGSEMLVRGGVALAHKGESELGVGNVLGSNVFNLGLVVGTAFTIRPGAVPTFVLQQDVLILVGATILVGLIVLRKGRISRLAGGLMLAFFVSYLAFIAIRGG